jgi:hypothetical protein
MRRRVIDDAVTLGEGTGQTISHHLRILRESGPSDDNRRCTWGHGPIALRATFCGRSATRASRR